MEQSIHTRLFSSEVSLREHRMIGFADTAPEAFKTPAQADAAKNEMIAKLKENFSPEAQTEARLLRIQLITGKHDAQAKEVESFMEKRQEELNVFKKQKGNNEHWNKQLKAEKVQKTGQNIEKKDWIRKVNEMIEENYNLIRALKEKPTQNADERIEEAAKQITRLTAMADEKKYDLKLKPSGSKLVVRGDNESQKKEFDLLERSLLELIQKYKLAKNEADPILRARFEKIAKADVKNKLEQAIATIALRTDAILAGKLKKNVPVDAANQLVTLLEHKKTLQDLAERAFREPAAVTAAVSTATVAAAPAKKAEAKEKSAPVTLDANDLKQVEKLKAEIAKKDSKPEDQQKLLSLWNRLILPADQAKQKAVLLNNLLKDTGKKIEIDADNRMKLVDIKVEAPAVVVAPTEKEKATLEKILQFLKELLDAFTKGAEKGFLESMSKYVDVGVMKGKLKDLDGAIFKKEAEKKNLKPSSPECKKCEEELAALKKEKAALEKRIQECEEQQKKAAETAKNMNQEFTNGKLPLVCTTIGNGVKVAPKPNCTPQQKACAEGQMQYVQKQAVKAGAVVETPRRAGNSMFITVIDRSIRINGDNNIVNSGEGGMRGRFNTPEKPSNSFTRRPYYDKRYDVGYRRGQF